MKASILVTYPKGDITLNSVSESWGSGPARLTQPATNEETERVLFLSDLHAPFHDEAIFASALRLIKKVKPHRIVINGDTNDFFQLSRFNTAMERLDLLQSELDAGNVLRARIRAAAPNAVIHETEGNHDSRLVSYVSKNAHALRSLDAIKPESLFAWRELNIESHGIEGFLLRRNFLVIHGGIVRQEAGATAKAEALKHGLNGASGHTHRLAFYRKTSYDPLEWWESGCLCQLSPDYVPGVPNWQHGLLIGHFSTSSDAFIIEPVNAFNGNLFYGGKSV